MYPDHDYKGRMMNFVLNQTYLDSCIEEISSEIPSLRFSAWFQKRLHRVFMQSCLREISLETTLSVFENYEGARRKVLRDNNFIDLEPPMDFSIRDAEVLGTGIIPIKSWINEVQCVPVGSRQVLSSMMRISSNITGGRQEFEKDLDDLIIANATKIKEWYDELQIIKKHNEDSLYYMHIINSTLRKLGEELQVTEDWIKEKFESFDKISLFVGGYDGEIAHVVDWARSVDLYSSMPPSPAFDHVIALAKKTIRNLDKISFKDAGTHADKWFNILNNIEKDYSEDPNGLEEILKVETGVWVRLTSELCLIREGKLMDHCVGGGSYTVSGSSPLIKIYSLRDADNQPWVTIETNRKGGIRQIKGRKNSVPDDKFRKDILSFLNHSCVATPSPITDLNNLRICQNEDGVGFRLAYNFSWNRLPFLYVQEDRRI